MNSAAFWRLAWKEYRAARAFWLALIALVIGAQLLTLLINDFEQIDPGRQYQTLRTLYAFALAAPAFFALGCAGAAFAGEREEGTYEFLRASTISSRQALASKWSVTVAGAAAMLVVLCFLAFVISGGHVPESAWLGRMSALWLLAALEATAWATLFSLRSARPLVAIVLGLVVASSVTNLLAWLVSEGNTMLAELTPYRRALPWRLAVLGVVTAADVYFGLRWLAPEGEQTISRTSARKAKRLAATSARAGEAVTRAVATDDSLQALLARPTRSTILSRLLWQHMRQSWRLMALVAGLLLPLQFLTALLLSLVSMVDNTRLSNGFAMGIAALSLVAMAGLGGACVFLPDKERHSFRFFAEHCVPPRYVWFSRQVPWMVLTLAMTAIALLICIVNTGLLEVLIRISYGPPLQASDGWVKFPVWFQWPPIFQTALAVLMVYAAGQWVSMFVRSGLLAALFALVAALALIGWAALMSNLGISWAISVLPIPCVLLWATWLRAPDWITENNSWSARGRAARAVLFPAAALLLYVPSQRVLQVPAVEPGFDREAYLAEITPAALKTGELYRQANEALEAGELSSTAAAWSDSIRHYYANALHNDEATFGMDVATYLWMFGNSNTQNWLKTNAKALDLVLAASREESSVVADPRTNKEGLRHANGLALLLLASAHELETSGKLDEALERYFTTFTMISQLGNHALYDRDRRVSAQRVLLGLANWGVQPGQTPERLQAAIRRLETIDGSMLRLSDGIKTKNIIGLRAAHGDLDAATLLSNQPPVLSPNQFERQLFLMRLMPWERYREARTVNWNTNRNLQLLGDLQRFVRDKPLQLFLSNPDACELAAFEASRRATLLQLAMAGYQLSNGSLPDSLEALAIDYFDPIPLDPYSGEAFIYFREGVPKFPSPADAEEFSQARFGMRDLKLTKPYLWSSGPRLRVFTPLAGGNMNQRGITQYYRHDAPGPMTNLPTFTAWGMGLWFTIPEKE